MAKEGFQHRYAEVNGIRMHYVIHGDGYPLVLLHGWPQTWYSWRKVIGPLSEQFRIVAPDMRGFGATDKPDNGYGIKNLARDIAELMAVVGIERATVVGHDLGAGVAFRLALDYPQSVERLVIIDMGYPVARSAQPPDQARLLNSWYVYFFLIPELPERLVGHEVEAFLRHCFSQWSYNKESLTEDDMAEYVRAYSQPGALSGGFNHYRARYSEDVAVWNSDAQSKIQQPTLVLWGEADIVVPPQRSDGMHRYIPHITFRFIPQCGHFVQEERPEIVIQEIGTFLADKARSQGV